MQNNALKMQAKD